MNYHYGYLFQLLGASAEQIISHSLANTDLTAAQGKILAFVGAQKLPPCPKDIELEFNLCHPTVSGFLSKLSQKGYVEIRQDPCDRRMKRIYLTEKGQQSCDILGNTVLYSEDRIVAGFTDEEQAQFTAMLKRAIANMGGELSGHKLGEKAPG